MMTTKQLPNKECQTASQVCLFSLREQYVFMVAHTYYLKTAIGAKCTNLRFENYMPTPTFRKTDLTVLFRDLDVCLDFTWLTLLQVTEQYYFTHHCSIYRLMVFLDSQNIKAMQGYFTSRIQNTQPQRELSYMSFVCYSRVLRL